jgi:rubrerythrin
MNLSNGSPSFEFALVPESRIEQIADKLDESEHLGSDAFYGLIDEVKTTVYRCPSCGRIHVDGGNGLLNTLVPEGLA